MRLLVVAALAERHRVTVLCGRPSYDPTERHPPYLLRREVAGNLAIERVGSTAFPRFRMTAARLQLPHVSCFGLAASADDSLRRRASDDRPAHRGHCGFLVARLSGRPFVYNLRDMYPDMALGGEIVRPGTWVERWEKRCTVARCEARRA
jgi:hypothetical protein